MRRITTVISGTGQYEICENDKGFWAIEREYIGADGRLKQVINGIQGALSETFEQAVKTAMFRGKIKEYTESHNPTQQELLEYMATII